MTLCTFKANFKKGHRTAEYSYIKIRTFNKCEGAVYSEIQAEASVLVIKNLLNLIYIVLKGKD